MDSFAEMIYSLYHYQAAIILCGAVMINGIILVIPTILGILLPYVVPVACHVTVQQRRHVVVVMATRHHFQREKRSQKQFSVNVLILVRNK
jgi:hypothetical protein